MKKEDIMSRKERKANEHMAYVFLLLIILMSITIFLEMIGIFILPKLKSIICFVAIIILAIIPCYCILVLRIYDEWVKYMVVSIMCLIAGICFSVFTFHMIPMLYIPIFVASIYNDKKILYITTVIDVLVMFISHILAPLVNVNVNEPLYKITDSLVFGFLPRLLFLVGVVYICYINTARFNNTINNVLEYSEELEKSTNGLKRIFIECHDMLMAENNNMFILNVGGSLFRIVKFLKGNRENVKCLIVLKDENKFIAINELYERKDECVSLDDKFLKVKYADKDYKIVRENIQNEGNCVASKDKILMTFYDKEELVGFIVMDASLDMETNANKVTMNVLYNSIKLCISTKQAENQMRESQEKLIYQFSQISESKSLETGQHIKRVSEYARIMGKSICKSHKECDDFACAAMLHDIGKLIVPSAILDKPAKLTDEEFEIIKEISISKKESEPALSYLKEYIGGKNVRHNRKYNCSYHRCIHRNVFQKRNSAKIIRHDDERAWIMYPVLGNQRFIRRTEFINFDYFHGCRSLNRRRGRFGCKVKPVRKLVGK